MNYLNSINSSLDKALGASEKVLLIGEDILDPYGGAFKVTKGLSTKYPDQTYTTPISESAIIGISTGLAIRGFLPVAEIMFGDFLTLCLDQLLNNAAKIPLMYEGNVTVPLVIRTPMGGGRGYGPTHSQSIEKLFMGIPGLTIVSPSIFHNPGDLIYNAIFNENQPVLFVEYKQLYSEELIAEDESFFIKKINAGNYPVVIADNFSSGSADIIVWGYGSTSLLLKNIAIRLKEEEINIRLIIPSYINQFALDTLEDMITSCDNHMIIEEGTEGFNWGSELSAKLYEQYFDFFKRPIMRMASKNEVIAASKNKEYETLINQEKIENKIFQML